MTLAVCLTGCPFETTLMSRIRAMVEDCRDTHPGQGGTVCGGIARQYDFVCGNITVDVEKDNADAFKASGVFRWTVPAGSRFARRPCALDARGSSCCQADNCDWRGLDRPETGPDATDCIRRWRTETCASPGFREGKLGRVLQCPDARVDVLIPGVGLDLGGDVE